MATATQATTAAATDTGQVTDTNKPLWPNNQKLQFILVTGEYESGKTLFGLMVDPEGRTLHLDTEDSAEPYEGQIPFDRIDIPAELAAKFPDGNYRPVDLHNLINEVIKRIPDGKYKVGVLDCGTEYEDGAVSFVQMNPTLFGYTANQFAKSQALMWGAVKSYLKKQLSFWNTKFETFVVCMHMRDEWKGGAPTGKREAKGKETLSELASLALCLERPVLKNGKKQEKPSAVVLKSRLSYFKKDEKTGELEPHPLLPPRMPEATPAAIRRYILSPANYDKLAKGEKIEIREMSEEDRLHLEARIAEDQRAAAEANAQSEMAKAAKAKFESQPRTTQIFTPTEVQQDNGTTAEKSGQLQQQPQASDARDAQEKKGRDQGLSPNVKNSTSSAISIDGSTPEVPGAGTSQQVSQEQPNDIRQETTEQPPFVVELTGDQLQRIGELVHSIGFTQEQWRSILRNNFNGKEKARQLTKAEGELCIRSLEAQEKKVIDQRAAEAEQQKRIELDEWAGQALNQNSGNVLSPVPEGSKEGN